MSRSIMEQIKEIFDFQTFFLTTYEHMMSEEKALYWSQELSGTKDLLLPAQSYIMHSILKQWIATKWKKKSIE